MNEESRKKTSDTLSNDKRRPGDQAFKTVSVAGFGQGKKKATKPKTGRPAGW